MRRWFSNNPKFDNRKLIKYISDEEQQRFTAEDERIGNRPVVRIQGFSIYANRYDLVSYSDSIILNSACHILS